MQQDNRRALLNEPRRQRAIGGVDLYVNVKICGITNLGDALCAARAGADLLGFVFYERSPRYVSPASVRAIVRGLRAELDEGSPPGLAGSHAIPRLVGVFVNEHPEAVARIIEYADLDLAQLHGDEPPDALQMLVGRSYKAVRPQPGFDDLDRWGEYARLGLCPGPSLLVDAYSAAAYGGTGRLADWSLATSLARQIPGLLLAGGLTPDNVTAAIEEVRPWGVDVSSGVESSPGVKDRAAVAALVSSVRHFSLSGAAPSA